MDITAILTAFILILLNGFFVAAEFALVKIRPLRLKALVEQKRPLAKTTQWLFDRLEASLSACQIGITMASLALGWVGEPAFAHIIEPFLLKLGLQSASVIHTTTFILAFSIITSLHLVIGEQMPKIFAIRQAERVALWCAVPLKFIYILLYPFLTLLNKSTNLALKLLRIEADSEHDSVHTENEIRAILKKSHTFGEVSLSEHRLVNAVFEFDDILCKNITLFRNEVIIIDVQDSLEESMNKIHQSKHSRYPVCKGSLDYVIGILHIKDLVGQTILTPEDLIDKVRPARYVPETLPITKLLQHFQTTRQLMALTVDEHGTTTGIVTLENVLEKIVGPVDDEFDNAIPNIIPSSPNTYTVLGSTPLFDLQKYFNINLEELDSDTVSGLIMSELDRIPVVGDKVQFENLEFKVTDVKHRSVRQVSIKVS